MGLFDDVNRFFEERLDEFMRNNPHLEIQAILEQIEEQEQDTIKLIAQLQLDEKRLQDEILSLAQDIQTWHSRAAKAKSAGRVDLERAAQEREASLLRQGNLVWGQMEGVKKRITQSKELLTQIREKKKEVKAKAATVNQTTNQTNSDWDTMGWNQGKSNYQSTFDTLEQQFKDWEMEEELQQMKRNMGR